MAGVVAMASVIEDFDTQACKKSRKDVGSPVVKMITNYFSPVPKPTEKPFCPPRSNKIMDYFSRKAQSSKEKASPPQQLKENCQKPHSAEKHISSEVVKQASEKRRRKTSRAARKLVSTETDTSCLIVEETHESKDLMGEAFSSYGTLSSNTPSAETPESDLSDVTDASVSNRQDEGTSPLESVSNRDSNVKLETVPNTTVSPPAVPSRVDVKQVKTARKLRKRQQKESNHPEEEEKESVRPQCDASMEVTVDESSLLNSTVTISFEDFVRSQNKTDEDIKDDNDEENYVKISAEADELSSEQLDIPSPKDGSVVPSVQVSPRTVTIQAEVHVVSSKQGAVKSVGKVASIFNRKRASNSPVKIVSSPHTDDIISAPPLNVKRRSNVVVQEEDLDLAVIESESTPKCSEAERKQFMAAFKQPILDGSKTKPVKSQMKQKQSEEKSLEAAEDDEVIILSNEQGSQENKEIKKKPTKQGRSQAQDEKEKLITSPTASEKTLVTIDAKIEEPPVTPSAPALRRSKREAVVRQTPEIFQTTPVRKIQRRRMSEGVAPTASPQDSPTKISTPKRRRSKHGVFVAEMLSPPDVNESPIRIKFSRVQKKAETGRETTKASNESKKMKQAKKLVEKAKMIQQIKKTCAEKETLRRSSRVKTSVKRSYCEYEDSVICVEDLSTPQSASRKTQKSLRSLNDVLGKATSAGKETKTLSASKAISLSQEKSSRKASGVISIFDESSHEGSENSQDDEQFRARREFLKSGLPESFKKQIAKSAATKEAYSASSSSYQPVTHTTQPTDSCPLWSLPWPESSLFSHLKDIRIQTLDPLPSVCGSLCVKTEPAYRNIKKKVLGGRPEISESVRQLLMEDFISSNPHFPAQMFFTRLLKRRTNHQQQTTTSETEALVKGKTCTPLAGESVGGKRKRKDDERDNSTKLAKKQKSNHLMEKICEAGPKPTKRGSQTRRGLRSRLRDEEAEGERMKEKNTSLLSEEDSVIVLDDLILEGDARKKDVSEDLLWTDKYQPQHSSDIVDNAAAVKRLYSWLKEWKLRADREERKNLKEKKQEEGDSDWDCAEDDFQDGEDTLCNTVLITGPTGVGKTAAVYACAQELGFKVFEVNASSQRSGRLILSQLKEATQSHQVDSQGVNAYKPTYFNSYGSSSCSVRPGSSPRKVNSPRKVVCSPRKTPQSPRSAKKGALAPTSLTKFFKMGQPANKEPQKPTKHEETAPSKKVLKENKRGEERKDVMVKEESSEEQNKKAATSLILFEEVDVIFEDDSGFLAAIKTFMSTTKRPVILTTSDPAFSTMFDGSFEEIRFKTPSPSSAVSYLQLLCLAEDVRTSPSDVSSLLKLNGFDIRQSLLQLQFWTSSSGGRCLPRPLMQTSQNAELNPETEVRADGSPVLPPCDSGCTESKLGLLNVEPDRDIWDLLRSQSLMDEAVCWELLTDSRRRGVDLLYSNMESLLPLPLTQLTTSKRSKPERRLSLSQSGGPKQQLSDTIPESSDFSDGGSPLKVSDRMKRNKKRSCLADWVQLLSESDSEDAFPSFCKRQIDPHKEEVKESIKRKPLTMEERQKSLPVTQCLESIADFWDNMSYMDSSLTFHLDGKPPVNAVIKDGMLDESRVETSKGHWLMGGALEIQAAVEALSFHKCRAAVVEAWVKVQQLEGELGKEATGELTLPVAAHQESHSFTPDGPCRPQLLERRKEVLENLMFQAFGTLGNRNAVALDYLPTIRTICRSEQLKEQGRVKRRFLHYLDAIHLGFEKNTLQLLAEDFP